MRAGCGGKVFATRVKASTAVPLQSKLAVSTSLYSESLLPLIYRDDL